MTILEQFKHNFINFTEKKIWSFDEHVVYDLNSFAWNQLLEENWQQIRDEFLSYWKKHYRIPSFHEISKAQLSITDDDYWKMLVLYAYGHKIEQTCQHFPKTTELVSQIPGLKSAMFSILFPHKHIPYHKGNVKMILRYHLPVMVPQNNENCFLRIDNRDIHWQEGRGLLFDDNYYHEVFNNTDEIRVVLFLDVLRPLGFPLNKLRDLSFYFITQSNKIQSAYRNLDSFYWQ